MARDTGIGRVTWTVMLVVGLSVAVACSRTPPEQRLRGQLSAMQQALEERRAADFMDGVAEDFAGNRGMDRAALQ